MNNGLYSDGRTIFIMPGISLPNSLLSTILFKISPNLSQTPGGGGGRVTLIINGSFALTTAGDGVVLELSDEDARSDSLLKSTNLNL